MTDTAKIGVPDGSQLPSLVRDLLQQPFAQARQLAQASWEQVCALLEGSLPADPTNDPLRESFEQAKATYCLILMELEAHQITPPADQPMSAWFSAPAAPKAPPAKPAKKANAIELSGPTKEYWAVAQHLAEQAKSPLPFPREYAERFQALSLIFAVECECQRLFVPALSSFWPDRQNAIREIVADANAFALKKELRATLDEHTKQHSDWLGDTKFPHTVVSMALRYLFARLSHQDFVPALSEAGALLLFFGPVGKIGDWSAKNVLGFTGINAAETMEISFRLFQAQRLRKRLLTPGEAMDAQLLAAVVLNSKRAVQLAHKIRAPKPVEAAA